MVAVILAGGQGTRLKSISKELPKPMVPIEEKPVLAYQIESLKQAGISEIVLIVGYRKERIMDYFKKGEKWRVNIHYIIENEPLGTAGALYYLKNKLKEPFFLIFGDLMLDIDWKKMAKYHYEKNREITLFAHPNSHPFDSDLLEINQEGMVVAWHSKHDKKRGDLQNLVNAGIYIVTPKVLNTIKKPSKSDFEKNILLPQIKSEKVCAYCSSEYVKDIGTEERYHSVIQDYKNGIMAQKNWAYPQKAIFLDRDGTINESNGFINQPEKFKLLPNTAEAIKTINLSGFLCIVITNQPVLARGECSYKTLKAIHNKMETVLGDQGAYVDALYFCPHHPDKGFESEVESLKKECDCRKPKIGLIKKAIETYHIDLEQSWFVGDTTTDIQTGVNAGMRTVLLQTGEAGEDGKYKVSPTLTALNLKEAIKKIQQKNK